MVEEGVTIQLQENKRVNNGGDHTYPGYNPTGTSKQIQVKQTTEPQGSDFLKYTHADSGGLPFILKAIQGDIGNPTNGITMNNTANVSSVSAYYWRYDLSKTLMVKVVEEGGKTTYYRKNDGTGKDWIELTGYNTSKPPLINGDIERTLDDLVCLHHNSVIIDVGKSVSMGDRREPYCCRCHGKGGDGVDQRKIYVKQQNVCCKHKNAEYYKHDISGNHQLAKIRYYLDGPGDLNTNTPSQRRRIKLATQTFPIPGVQAVYTLYCGGNPVLIYVEGGGTAEGWYKKPPGNNSTDELWTKVQDLKGITPENFGTLDCTKWNQLVDALKTTGCNPLKECTKEEVPAADLSDQIPDTKSETNEQPEVVPSEPTTETESDAPPGKTNSGVAGDGLSSPQQPQQPTSASVVSKADSVPVEAKGDPEEGGSAATLTQEKAETENSGSLSNKGKQNDEVQATPATERSHGQSSGATLSSALTSPEAAGTEKFVLTTPAVATISLGTIFGASSGTLAGSAATFFGGWKLYNRYKGDPWVRQI